MTSERMTRKAGSGKVQTAPVVRKEKVRDGVIVAEMVSVDLTGSDAAAQIAGLREIFPDAAKLIAKYRAKVKTIIDGGAFGSRLRYAQDAAERFDLAAKYLGNIIDKPARENADGVALNLLWAMEALWRVDVKRVEPEIVTGAKLRTKAKRENDRRARQANDEHAEWQRKASEIWGQNSRLTASDVAKRIDPIRWGTIRRYIRK